MAIFISAIKHAAVQGKKGSKCEKRLGNGGREGRSWTGISAPATASSAANATILTQSMTPAPPSLNDFNKAFSCRPAVIDRCLIYKEGFLCVFSKYAAVMS